MNSELHKKQLILAILRILERYSDENHPLTQQMIKTRLEKDYDMTASNKAIKNNLELLEEFGYDICYTVIPRGSGASDIKTDYYLIHKLSDGQLQLLIDNVVFSGKLPKNQAKELVDTLYSLSSDHFKTKAIIASMPDSATTTNQSLFLNIETLNEAIRRERGVSFHYLEYHTDSKLHKRIRADGSVREYIINPYYLVTKGGRNYLICNNDKHDSLSNYRVDRIADIRILENKVRKPISALKDSNGAPLDLKKYMDEHIYMFAGKSVRAQLRVKKFLLDEMYDRFGSSIRFKDESEDSVTAVVTANESALLQFAKELMPHIELLSPRSVREKLTADLTEAMRCYSAEKD